MKHIDNEVMHVFREMRRAKQALSRGESLALLERATSGVLAVLGDGDYPYAVPLSFVCHEEKIYFHCAMAGHKLDAVKRHPKASFCVIGQDHVLSEKYTTCFRSVIAFGRVRMLEDPAEKLRALELLAAKYSPGQAEGRKQEIDQQFDRVCMLELSIEHLTGKEAIELTKRRQAREKA